jgi:eukaryotic-like serine/threonine-protein kinase
MSMGKVLVVTVITSAATSAATFFALRSLSGPGGSREALVPDVSGLRLEQARAMLDGRSLLLAISDTVEDAKVEAGRIVRQTPQAGSTLRTGSEVRVVVSAGQPPVEVPSLLHLPLQTATELLTGAGLKVGTVTRREDEKEAAGQVLESRPASGQKLPRGSAVELILSSGAAAIKVPSVLGRTQAQAAQTLIQAGFKAGRVSFGYDEDRRAGVVIKQTPAGDTMAPRGSAVNLVLNEND